jgi:hypothetical protein
MLLASTIHLFLKFMISRVQVVVQAKDRPKPVYFSTVSQLGLHKTRSKLHSACAGPAAHDFAGKEVVSCLINSCSSCSTDGQAEATCCLSERFASFKRCITCTQGNE